MMHDDHSPIGQDKLQAAIKELSELTHKHPEKSRSEIIHEIQLKFDLSPLDCEFLHRHFLDEK